ncbi:hypothetical protein MVEN_00355200 [Mycena venus]|uniref:F-box domain-containing protein n=1 Tax=Mycena venus TaxID=2733690 RepID=A0A8H6YUF8_9AGAR|nr:hypothetical protein MVEN_00355200 [Mycena venus]
MSLADSPFIDRLNTNYVPSDSEICEIRTLLVDPVDELAKLDAQIEEMEITLSLLKEKRASLQAPIDAHRALISPMRHVPLDVLQEIFFSCLPTEHNALIDPAEAPLLLGQICSHWRSVAYSTPRIWSSLHIPSFDSRSHSVPSAIFVILGRIVERWLKRSGNCSLSISLSSGINSSLDFWSEDHPILSPLLQVRQRLRHLELSADTQSLRQLLRLGPKDLPILKTIRIQASGDPLFDGNLEATNALQLPTLEDISLSFSATSDPLSLPLNWSQLTGLSLVCYPLWTGQSWEGGFDAGGVLDVLRSCPNLVRCEFGSSKSLDPGSTINRSLITLSHLQFLLLGSHSIPPEYMSCLILPKLSYLKYGDVTFGAPGNDHVFDSSLTADIDPTGLTSSQCFELLRRFPSISVLRLSSPAYHHDSMSLDDAFLALFYTPNGLCPMLTDFTVMVPCARFSDTAALAFVKARMAMTPALQQFRFHFNRPVEVDIMPELRPFILGGLKAALHYPLSEWKFDARAGLSDATTFITE